MGIALPPSESGPSGPEGLGVSTYSFNNFQISAAGLGSNPTMGNQQTRESDNKLSSFGALSFGPKSTADYTKVEKGFKGKDEIQNPSVPEIRISGNGNWVGSVSNPFLEGSTTKKLRDEAGFVMTFGTRTTKPIVDVMDTFVAHDTTKLTRIGFNALYFPDEGVKYFGTRASGSPAGPVLVVETSGPPI